jgi:hypothetical protein
VLPPSAPVTWGRNRSSYKNFFFYLSGEEQVRKPTSGKICSCKAFFPVHCFYVVLICCKWLMQLTALCIMYVTESVKRRTLSTLNIDMFRFGSNCRICICPRSLYCEHRCTVCVYRHVCINRGSRLLAAPCPCASAVPTGWIFFKFCVGDFYETLSIKSRFG